MLLLSAREYQDIVQIHTNTLVKVSPKDAIHSVREHRRSVYKSKRQNPPLKFAKVSVERSLGDIRLLQLELMVPRRQVKHAKVFGTREVVNQVINAWRCKLVFYSDFVQTR